MNETRDLERLVFDWLQDYDEDSWEEGTENEGDAPLKQKGQGALAIRKGQLYLKKPERGGKWPTIAPGKKNLVKILYRGEPIRQPLVVEDVDAITMEVARIEARSSFEIIISKDKMKVWLETKFVAGIDYEICDSDYKTSLLVTTCQAGLRPPPLLQPDLVVKKAKAMGIKVELDRGQIERACASGRSERVLIGEGKPIQPPRDGKIEIVWERGKKEVPQEEGGRIDPLDRGGVESVEAGEVLAYWHPPLVGAEGVNVFLETVKPPLPKNARLRAGPGVKLMEDETMAVAETAGRPCFERGRLCVRPQLVIPHDVDVATGNVEFTGDVIVNGDVKESLTIKAGGKVEVRGGVYHAQVFAGGDVIIQKSLIGGHVSAGGEIASCLQALALIKRIVPRLKKLQRAFAQLKRHPNFSVGDLEIRGDGYLLKLILEIRFADIPKLFTELQKAVGQRKGLAEDDELAQLAEILQHVSSCFLGAQPLQIKSIAEIETHLECLIKTRFRLEEILGTTADIKAYYCQNAQLEATGDITVTGPLVYGCTMTAGARIQISGACRRGSYFANQAISVGAAGLNETVRTELAVDEQGAIMGETLYPGVHLAIGQGKMIMERPRHNVKIQFADGQWVKKVWK